MWNSKIGEGKAITIAEQLAEGTSVKGTARLTRVSREAIRRLASQLGRQAERIRPWASTTSGSNSWPVPACRPMNAGASLVVSASSCGKPK